MPGSRIGAGWLNRSFTCALANEASACLVATPATAVATASTAIPTAVIAVAMTPATVTTVKAFRVVIPEMATAEVLSVEKLAPVVGTFQICST